MGELQARVDALDSLPEALRDFYTEKDGAYILNVKAVGGLALEDAGGLKSALSKERQNHDATKAKLRVFEGIDPEQARTAIEKLAEIDEKGGLDNLSDDEKVKAKLDTLTRQLTEKFDAERKKLKGEAETLTQRGAHLTETIRNLLVDSKAAQALAKHKGEPKLLMDIIRRYVRVHETADGEFQVQVMEDDGKTARLTRKTGSEDLMGVEEFVETLKEDSVYARAFEGHGAAGSGATGSGGGSTRNGHIDPKLPPEERLRLHRQQKGVAT